MYSIDIKNWAVKLYHEKYRTVRRTARALDISKSTIHRWVRQFPPLQRQRQRRFDHERIRAAVLRELQQNPLHTVASLRRAVRDALRENGQPSDYAIRAALQTLRWTRKKVFHRTVPGGGHREKQATFLRDVDGLHDWISVDETSIALDMAPLYGYSPKGQRLVMRRNRRPRFERFTLVMAVTRSEVVAHETVRGSMNSERFAAFVLGIPDHFRGHALLMDNVRFHHTRQVAEAMAAKHFRPVFIPPYSPQFNPIENAFSVMKSQFRRLHEVEDTEQRILLAIQALTAPKLDGFYRHTEQHILLLRNELA